MKNATIISILPVTDKTVLMKYTGDMGQWSIYLTMSNLSHKIRSSQVRPGDMIVGLISIQKSDPPSIKMEIYYQTLRVITQDTCNYRLIYIGNEIKLLCLALGTSS